jgi:hypothetical protein
MIPSNAALVEEYWERLPALPLEERRLAGREPPLEQRSEGQPGYLGESLLHLHPHRAPITATQPTDILLTDIRAMVAPDIRDTPLIPVPQAMDTQAAQDIPPTPVLRVTDTQATQGILLIPAPQATDTQATRHTPLILVLQTTDTQARREIPLIPLPQDMDTQATRGTSLILDPQAMDTPSNSGHPADPGNPAPGYQDNPPYSHYPGPGYGYPMYGYPRRSSLGGLVTWGRLRYRAFWLRFDPNARPGRA